MKPTVEGVRGQDDWLLVDCGPLIVHLFTEAGRNAYDLEGACHTHKLASVYSYLHRCHADSGQSVSVFPPCLSANVHVTAGLWSTSDNTQHFHSDRQATTLENMRV